MNVKRGCDKSPRLFFLCANVCLFLVSIMLKAFLRAPTTKKIFSNQFHTIMSQRSFSAACCIIGDEILNGKTRDSNANYLGNISKQNSER